MMVEFDCIDCGDQVVVFGQSEAPADHHCAICRLIAKIADPEEREFIRGFLIDRYKISFG